MAAIEDDPHEAGIPELAAHALTAASRRAAQAGRPVVLAKDGVLVRIDQSGTTVLKQLPARLKVTNRIQKRNHE
jgi:hypothetical protein